MMIECVGAPHEPPAAAVVIVIVVAAADRRWPLALCPECLEAFAAPWLAHQTRPMVLQ